MAFETNVSATSIVVAGQWNPAIIQPAWLATTVFSAAPESIQVEVAFSTVAGHPPRFKMRDLEFVVTSQRLAVHPHSEEPQRLAAAEDAAKRILDALTHTPIQGLGINFEINDRAPTGGMLGLFYDMDQLAENTGLGLEIIQTSHSKTMRLENHVVNFSRTLLEGGSVQLAFNFHHGVNSAAEASTRLGTLFSGHAATMNAIAGAISRNGVIANG